MDVLQHPLPMEGTLSVSHNTVTRTAIDIWQHWTEVIDDPSFQWDMAGSIIRDSNGYTSGLSRVARDWYQSISDCEISLPLEYQQRLDTVGQMHAAAVASVDWYAVGATILEYAVDSLLDCEGYAIPFSGEVGMPLATVESERCTAADIGRLIRAVDSSDTLEWNERPRVDPLAFDPHRCTITLQRPVWPSARGEIYHAYHDPTNLQWKMICSRHDWYTVAQRIVAPFHLGAPSHDENLIWYYQHRSRQMSNGVDADHRTPFWTFQRPELADIESLMMDSDSTHNRFNDSLLHNYRRVVRDMSVGQWLDVVQHNHSLNGANQNGLIADLASEFGL